MNKIKATSLLVILSFSVFFSSCGNQRIGTPEEQIVSAVVDGDIEAVRELLKNGVSANTRDKDFDEIDKGAPIIFFAAAREMPEHFEIVKLLVENGAEINFYHDTAYTPLMTAIENNNVETVNFLLASGADLEMWFPITGSPLSRATKLNHTEIMAVLKSHGAKE